MNTTKFGIDVHLVPMDQKLDRVFVGEVQDIMALYLRNPDQDLQIIEFNQKLRSDTDVNHQILLNSKNATNLNQTPQLDFYIDYSYSMQDTTGQVYTFGERKSILCKPAPSCSTASSNCNLKVFATRDSLDKAHMWLKMRYPWEF
jgi:hypothetical protein